MFILLFELQDGDTALHIAVLSDNIEIIKVLVEAGADFGIKNDVSSTIWFLDAHKMCFWVILMTFLCDNKIDHPELPNV